MAERTHIPGSSACGAWETLLADALDGLLRPEDEARFLEHKAICPACSALYDEARKGREWLEFLSPEPEVPTDLLDKILAKTGPSHSASGSWAIGTPIPVAAGAGAVPAFVPPVWQQPGFFARLRIAAQPRFFLTAAMAFFSIALTLNLTGVRFSALHASDLRPRALRAYMERQLTMASVPIVRYYDHLRLVYEVESRVRELRGDDEGGSNQPDQQPTGKPGETRRNPSGVPGGRLDGPRTDPREMPGNPAMMPADPANEMLETSLIEQVGPTPSRGSTLQGWERSKVWIA